MLRLKMNITVLYNSLKVYETPKFFKKMRKNLSLKTKLTLP